MFIKINHTLKLFKLCSHFLAILEISVVNYNQQNLCKFQFLQFQNYQDNREKHLQKRLDIWYYYNWIYGIKLGKKLNIYTEVVLIKTQAEIFT